MSTTLRDLRVEYLREPNGLATERPRYSWGSDPDAPAQIAFELDVTLADGTSVWSTGRVESAQSWLVEHGGAALASNTAYAWRVRVWSADASTPSEWARATFQTALLSPDDWTASWIRPVQTPTTLERWSIPDWIFGNGPTTPLEERLRPVQLIRQRFPIDAAVARARLFATAHGAYAIAVNGTAPDDQVLAPGFDSYTHRVSAQSYDVTDLLSPGDNVLGLTLADGWWAGRIGLTGSSAQWGATTSAVWQLEIEYADGRTDVIRSGTDARSSRGPVRYADLFVGELFDRRQVIPGWEHPGFDDSTWTPVADSGESTATIVPFAGEPIRAVRSLAAVTISGSAPEGLIVDFGQVIAGRVRLRLADLAAGQVVTIEHTETLTPAGEWFANIAGINKQQTDVYIADGSENGEEHEPSFTFHGFRYARITGLTVEPALSDVTAVVLGSDLEATGRFRTSDARLNRLHENVVWSQRANFLSVPTDCPQRERAGWTGDIQVFAPAATNNLLVAPFLTRWLDNLRADQLPDGQVPIYSPRSPFDIASAESGTGIGAIVSAAGWSDAIAIVPWTLYERYADIRVLEENYPALQEWIDYQRRTAAEAIPAALQHADLSPERRERQELLYNTGDHFGDWLTPSTLVGRPFHEAIGIAPRLTSELLTPMFQANTLTIAARIAAVLGRHADAADYADRAARVRAAFAAEYLDAEGHFSVELQGLYVVALAFDMAPETIRPALANTLADLVTANGDRLDTGFLSLPYLLDVLWESGHRDLARRVLWQSDLPSWLYAVDHGATTIWESWDAIAEDGAVHETSLNHYAFGSVDHWLYRRVAGIQSTSPGYASVRIQPDLDAGVTEVDAAIDTPHGTVAVHWTRHGESAEITVRVPAGVEAELVVGDRVIALPSGESTHPAALEVADRGAVRALPH